MRALTSFIVGVIIGYLLLVVAQGSLVTLLNSIFLLTAVVALCSFFIYTKAHRLQKLVTYLIVQEETVTISTTPDSRTNAIKLCAVGRTPLYLRGYELPGHHEQFDRSRRIPSSKDTDSYYWLPSPQFKDLKLEEEFEFKLYLEDEHKNKWISEHGGILEKHPYQEGTFTMRIWSYQLEKE